MNVVATIAGNRQQMHRQKLTKKLRGAAAVPQIRKHHHHHHQSLLQAFLQQLSDCSYSYNIREVKTMLVVFLFY